MPTGTTDEDDGLSAILGPCQVGSGGELVGDGDPRRAQLAAGGVVAAPPVLERGEPGAADRDVGLAVPPRPPEGVSDRAPRAGSP